AWGSSPASLPAGSPPGLPAPRCRAILDLELGAPGPAGSGGELDLGLVVRFRGGMGGLSPENWQNLVRGTFPNRVHTEPRPDPPGIRSADPRPAKTRELDSPKRGRPPNPGDPMRRRPACPGSRWTPRPTHLGCGRMWRSPGRPARSRGGRG